MSENPLQETRFEMPVRVANLMRGSEERLCLEEGGRDTLEDMVLV